MKKLMTYLLTAVVVVGIIFGALSFIVAGQLANEDAAVALATEVSTDWSGRAASVHPEYMRKVSKPDAIASLGRAKFLGKLVDTRDVGQVKEWDYSQRFMIVFTGIFENGTADVEVSIFKRCDNRELLDMKVTNIKIKQ